MKFLGKAALVVFKFVLDDCGKFLCVVLDYFRGGHCNRHVVADNKHLAGDGFFAVGVGVKGLFYVLGINTAGKLYLYLAVVCRIYAASLVCVLY